MSDLLIGLLAWLGVAVVVSVVIGRFMRMSEPVDSHEATAATTGLSMLPGYGWEEDGASTLAVKENQAPSDKGAVNE
ncbi:MAG: hypothetical protein Q8Q28_06630 [Pseudomonadota bacterium]|nr:hypothetical protein [Pseudomonadota bacterium]